MPPPPSPPLEVALQLYHAGRSRESEVVCRQILAQQPNHPYALHLLAALAHGAGRSDVAEQLIRRAIVIHPADAQFHNTLGAILISTKRNEEAVRAFRQATFLRSGFAEAHGNLGTALQNLRRYDEAIACFRQSIALDPRSASTHSNLGNMLQEKGDFTAAAEAYRRAIAIDPEYRDAVRGLVVALTKAGQLDEAIAIARDALRSHADDGELHWRLAWAMLLRGDLPQAWTEFEWRGSMSQAKPYRRDFDQPRWNGEPLDGRRILIHPEQGVGDTIQFVRFVPQVTALGGRVILECQPPLVPLLEGFPGVEQVIAEGQSPLPPLDLHCPIMSLPAMLAITMEQIAQTATPYIRADASRIEQFRASLPDAADRLKVGLVWAGNADHPNDRRRSFSLSTLAPLWSAGSVSFFSLQKGPSAAQIKSHAHDLPLVDLGPQLNGFADTAAALACLDLLITADTAVAHLAGAMGKRVWVLLPTPPDWRWLLQRSESPWYPSMRLFRQLHAGDWSHPIAEIAAELDRFER